MKGLILYLTLSIFPGFASFTFAQDQKDSIAIDNFIVAARKIYLSNPDSAISLLTTAVDHSISSSSRRLEGRSYLMLSKAYWAKGNFRLSTEYGYKALKIFEGSPHLSYWIESLNSLGRTFTDFKDFSRARIYLNEALRLNERAKDTELLAATLREYSMFLTEISEYDSALAYVDQAMILYQKSNMPLDIGILYNRKSKIFMARNDFKESLKYSRLGLAIDSVVGNNRAMGIEYFNLALNLYKVNKKDSALYYLKRAIPLNSKLMNLSSLIKIHELLATIYNERNKPALAIEHLKISSQLKDSLFNAEKSGQIQEMQALYELNNKDKTIKMLGQENVLQQQEVRNQKMFVIVLSAATVFLVLLIVVLIRLRKIQAKANATLSSKNFAIEQQKEEIHAQAENLYQLNELKLKLFSVISHDLRGPIATLHSLLDLLTKKKMTMDEFLHISDKVKGNLNITQRTLENLLNWSLSQMEGIKTEKKVFIINHLVEDVCNLMHEVSQKKNVSVANKIEAQFHVNADPDQIQLILRNLLHNAIKFSEQNAEVIIEASQVTHMCKITIKDFGIGMSAEEIQTVTAAKTHFTKIGTQQEKGTGLGLPLCQEFIKKNGGALIINSQPGEGTEVSFTLLLAN